MDGRIEMILDGGEEVGIGLESTIVDLTGDIPMILRPGYVTQKMLEEVANQVDVDKTILDANCHFKTQNPECVTVTMHRRRPDHYRGRAGRGEGSHL